MHCFKFKYLYKAYNLIPYTVNFLKLDFTNYILFNLRYDFVERVV